MVQGRSPTPRLRHACGTTDANCGVPAVWFSRGSLASPSRGGAERSEAEGFRLCNLLLVLIYSILLFSCCLSRVFSKQVIVCANPRILKMFHMERGAPSVISRRATRSLSRGLSEQQSLY